MTDPNRPTRQWPGPPTRAGSSRPPGPPGDETAVPAPAGDAPPDAASAADDAVEAAEEQVDADLGEFAAVVAERDDYLDRLRRLQADFENYKKRVAKQQLEHRERAAEELLTQLLPVLDTFDLALTHGVEGVATIHRSMLDVLAGSGLERLDPVGKPFDPNEHDAVVHEVADDGGGPEVSEVLRAGYRWKGRVLRPAMVKVKG
ncbi:MAG: nucleotide exchange factor GrpE [Acidimicrobiales bacterium]